MRVLSTTLLITFTLWVVRSWCEIAVLPFVCVTSLKTDMQRCEL